MNDLEIRQFKNAIIDFMNKTMIPTEVKRLVLSEILTETTRLVDNDIRAQVQSMNEKKAEEDANSEDQESEPENSPE